MTKLNWDYHQRSGEYRAEHKGLVIRAVRVDDARNPFTDGDMNWPIVVRSSDRFRHDFTAYVDGVESKGHLNALSYLSDAQLVHDQRAIAKVYGFDSIPAIIECYYAGTDYNDEKYCRDADILRDAFNSADDDLSERSRLEAECELFKLAGIRAYLDTTSGYCQGDEAEVLVVALPANVEKFGDSTEHYRQEAKADPAIRDVMLRNPAGVDAWIEAQITERMLKSTVDLYGAWEWGDVYGYVVAREVELDDDEIELEELESCWGYYGSEFDESGLEEAAIEAAEGHVKEMVDA